MEIMHTVLLYLSFFCERLGCRSYKKVSALQNESNTYIHSVSPAYLVERNIHIVLLN